MDAALLSASLLWHLCPTPDRLPSPIFHGTLHAVKEVNKQNKGGKELQRAINLKGYESGASENTKKSLSHLK